jgi:hypothetical protein
LGNISALSNLRIRFVHGAEQKTRATILRNSSHSGQILNNLRTVFHGTGPRRSSVMALESVPALRDFFDSLRGERRHSLAELGRALLDVTGMVRSDLQAAYPPQA